MEKQEFSVRKFSNAVGTSGEAELKMLLESIDIPLRGLTVVRPVHSSVLARSHCFQITTPSETRYFTCNSEEDAYNWVTGLKDIIYPNRDNEKRIDTSLDVWIFEAKGLPAKKRYYCEIVLDKVLYGRTSTKLKADILFWGEQFSFDDLPSIDSLSLYVFRESESKKKKRDKSVFVGAVNVPLHSIQANCEVETWLSLRLPGVSPKPQPKNSSNKNDQPSVRVKVRYQTASILPINCYEELHKYIEINYLPLCQELEGVINLRAKDELAQTLIKILQSKNQAKEFLADIIFTELKMLENENLTFRGNTLATKSMDTYMKIVGTKYLKKTLGEFVSSLYDLEQDVEVDPARLTNGNLLENQKNLLKLVEQAWSRILNSFNIFPSELQHTLSLIKTRCENLGKDVSVKLISGSVFLRFLCPAILSPSLFHLTREYPNEKTARCLTLIAKALQNLANFTRFGGKEAYMEGLNEFVERELPNMKKFLDSISSKTGNSEHTVYEGYIDTGRELAVISELLTENLPKLCEESRSRLAPLDSILCRVRESFIFLDERADLLNDRQAVITRSNSLPRDAESRLFHKRSNDSTLKYDQNSCYVDATLSGTQDYVSGCSLILHTPSKPKGSILQRAKGRANDAKNQMLSSFQPRKRKGNEIDKHLLVCEDGKRPATPGHSSFLRSSSFHGRSSREEKQSVLMPSKSFDAEKLIGSNISKFGNHSYHGLKAAKSDSRLRSKSDESARGELNDESVKSLPISAEAGCMIKTSTSLNAIADHEIPYDSMTDGKKTIRRLPDIIHESVTWNDLTIPPNQPLYFSPATEPMTPLGKRQFKFGFGALTQEETSDNQHVSESFDEKIAGSSYRKDFLELTASSEGRSQQNNDNPYAMIETPCLVTSTSSVNEFSVLSGERCESAPCLDTCHCLSDDSDANGYQHLHDGNANTESRYTSPNERREHANMEIIDALSNKEDSQRDVNDDENENTMAELRRKLRETEAKMKADEADFMNCKESLECLVAVGRKKLEETEARMRKQKHDKDEQMKSIISRLVKVESELRKEQIEMQEIVQAKQKIIDVQEKRIKSLDSANRRLVSALKQLKMKHHAKNASCQSHVDIVEDGITKYDDDDDDSEYQQV